MFLLEFALIAGDVYYTIKDDFDPQFIYARLFFIICSTFNFVAVVWIMQKYNLWSLSYQGDITESDSVEQGIDQEISLFYRPSVTRMSEAEGDMRKLKANSKSRASNPMTANMQSVQEETSRESDVDSNL